MPERRRIGTLVATATIGLGVALAVRPVDTSRILAGYALALAAIALAALMRVLERSTDRASSEFEHALAQKPARPGRPPELVRVEREITLGVARAGHLHLRLVPLLREIAAARLGADLEHLPAGSRERLGDDAWELVRPDRPRPADPNGPGVTLERVESVVRTLERL